MKEIFHTLAPSNKPPQPEQYDLAWHLLGDAKASRVDRANAKCWLTYRAVDGDIAIEDWHRCVDSAALPDIPKGPFFYRWESSQKTAEVYLQLLHGEIEEYQRAKKELLQFFEDEPVVENWHQSALNLLRIRCLDIYETYLCDEDVKNAAIEAIEEWWNVWTSSAKKGCVLTYSEMNDGYQSVKVLTHILQKYGITRIAQSVNESPYTLLRPDSSLPFCRAMYWLGWLDRGKAIWVPPARKEGSKVQQYRIIHASKEYGKGGAFKKWLPFIQSKIDTANVRSAIDYGCGQSQDIVTVFPAAKHAFYDPAIQGKDTLPEECFDVGYCTEMLEHIPEEEIDAVLLQMRALSGVWFMTIHTGKANQILPNGENAHCTVQPLEWWIAKIADIFGAGTITTQNEQPSFAFIYKAHE